MWSKAMDSSVVSSSEFFFHVHSAYINYKHSLNNLGTFVVESYLLFHLGICLQMQLHVVGEKSGHFL